MEWKERLNEYTKHESLSTQFPNRTTLPRPTITGQPTSGRGHEDPLYLEGPRNHRHVCIIICVRKLQQKTLNAMDDMEMPWTLQKKPWEY